LTWQRLGFNLSPEEFKNFCEEIDTDKSGKIDYYEFKQAIPQFMRCQTPRLLKPGPWIDCSQVEKNEWDFTCL